MPASISHASLVGADLHETKGVESASNGAILVANGGQSSWIKDITPDTVTLTTPVFNNEVEAISFDFDAAVNSSKELFIIPSKQYSGGDCVVRLHYNPKLDLSGNAQFSFDSTDFALNISGSGVATFDIDSTWDYASGVHTLTRNGEAVADTYLSSVEVYAIEILFPVTVLGAVNA